MLADLNDVTMQIDMLVLIVSFIYLYRTKETDTEVIYEWCQLVINGVGREPNIIRIHTNTSNQIKSNLYRLVYET